MILQVKLSDKILERIATYGMLRIPHLDIEVSNPMASTTISLVLTNGCDGDKAQRYLISGFPRTFVQELPCEPTRSKTRPSSKHRSMAQSPPRHTRVSSDTARPRPTPTYPGRQSYSPASTPPPRPPPRPSRTSPSYHNAAHPQQHPIPELPQSLRIGDPASRLPNARNDRTHGGDEQSDGQVIPDYLVERAAERIRRDDERRARRTRDEERKLVRRRERRESERFER